MAQPQQQQKPKNTNNFMNYFNTKVLPVTSNIESYRSKIFIAVAVWAAIVAVPPLFFSLMLLFAQNVPIVQKLIMIATFLIPTAIAVSIPLFFVKGLYGMFAKEKVIPALLGFWGNYTYVPPMNIISAIYKAIKNKTGFGGFCSELTKDKKTNISVNPTILARVLQFSTINYDDKIVGKHNDVQIEIAELATSYTTTSRDSDGKKSSTKHTTFSGIVFSAKLNKNFKGITLVSYDNIDKRRALRPTVGAQEISSMSLADALSFGTKIAGVASAVKDMVNTAQEMQNQGKSQEEIQDAIAAKYGNNNTAADNQPPLKMDDVHLEDPLFNRKFKMCSTDQIEARYIFTTAFLNRFMKIAETFNYRLKAVFIDNNVYILIDSRSAVVLNRKNWFEVPFFKSCKEPKNYQEFLNDFSRLLAIVETLKLNQNIGM